MMSSPALYMECGVAVVVVVDEDDDAIPEDRDFIGITVAEVPFLYIYFCYIIVSILHKPRMK